MGETEEDNLGLPTIIVHCHELWNEGSLPESLLNHMKPEGGQILLPQVRECI